MGKFAIIGDGTGAHEHFVIIVSAENETEALEKAAQSIISNPNDDAVEMSTIDNHHSPTYECQLYNSHDSMVYALKTSVFTELDEPVPVLVSVAETELPELEVIEHITSGMFRDVDDMPRTENSTHAYYGASYEEDPIEETEYAAFADLIERDALNHCERNLFVFDRPEIDEAKRTAAIRKYLEAMAD